MRITQKPGLLLVFSVVISGCNSFQAHKTSDPLVTVTKPQQIIEEKLPSHVIVANQEKTAPSKIQVAQPKRPNQAKALNTNDKTRVTRSAEQAANNVMRPAAAMPRTNPLDSKTRATAKTTTPKTALPTNRQNVKKSIPATATVAKVETSIDLPAPTTVEQINNLIEENPTAAGVEAKTIASEKTSVPEVAIVTTPKTPSSRPKTPNSSANKTFDRKAFGIWTIEKSGEGQYAGICRVSTPTRQLDQPDYSTQLWLNIINDELIVNTSTSIDIKQQGVGIKTNNEKLTPFSKSMHSDTVVWSGDIAKILKNSHQLDIVIGGHELGKKTIATSFSLKNLKSAYSAYDDCRHL